MNRFCTAVGGKVGINPAVIQIIMQILASLMGSCPKPPVPPTPASALDALKAAAGGEFGDFFLRRAVHLGSREAADEGLGAVPISKRGELRQAMRDELAANVTEDEAAMFAASCVPE